MNVPPQSPNSAKITPRQGVCEACRQPIRLVSTYTQISVILSYNQLSLKSIIYM